VDQFGRGAVIITSYREAAGVDRLRRTIVIDAGVPPIIINDATFYRAIQSARSRRLRRKVVRWRWWCTYEKRTFRMVSRNTIW